MKVVANTTPLIGLASIGHFELLNHLFGQVQIARAVYDEVVHADGRRSIGCDEVAQAEWLKVIDVQDRVAVDVLLDELDLGETETIVLAREIQADWVIMDEKKGRQKLAQMGINKIGTLGILLKAKDLGLIMSLKPALDDLQKYGFSISQSVVESVLEQAGE